MSILGEILNEVGEEACRMVGQGSAELAAAIFSNSNGYVQYGDGQDLVEVDRTPEAPVQEQSQGIEM